MNYTPLMEAIKQKAGDPEGCARRLVAETPRNASATDLELVFKTAFVVGLLEPEDGRSLLIALEDLQRRPDELEMPGTEEDVTLAEMEARHRQLRGECEEVRQLGEEIERLQNERPDRERHREDLRSRLRALDQRREERRQLLQEVSHGNRDFNPG